MSNLLILTVGTGTAGKYSDLASGLRRTLELLAPRKFWLIPSTSPDSLAIADLIAEGQAAFAGRFPLEQPDDLESSRQHIRAVISRVRGQLKQEDRLLVNPTSGTKQMTAAATLAALDEQIGNIVFTTGKRADGVVKTGTERITTFNPSGYFRERDMALARDFFDAGDFYAAERMLKPHTRTNIKEYTTVYTCHHWRRFDYERAKAHANFLKNRSPRKRREPFSGWRASGSGSLPLRCRRRFKSGCRAVFAEFCRARRGHAVREDSGLGTPDAGIWRARRCRAGWTQDAGRKRSGMAHDPEA